MSRFQPASITSLTATVDSINSVTLTWVNGESNGVTIERSVGLPAGNPPENQFQPLATVGANVSTYTDTTVVAGTLYSYRVQTLPASDALMFTPAVGVTVNATTSGIPPHHFAQLLTAGEGNPSQQLVLVTDGSYTAGARG